jgi:hypothetical protein
MLGSEIVIRGGGKLIMNRVVFVPALVLMVTGLALAQGQRPPTPSEFSHTMSIEGAGKMTLTYKSLHWNGQAYLTAKQNEQIRERLNSSLWKRIGTLTSDFDLVMGGVQVPKGSYSLGINFDANDNFKLVLGSGGKDIMVPLQTKQDGSEISYLTFDLRPTETGSFAIEGRIGTFRSWAEIKVPSLSSTAGGSAQR